MEERYYDDPPLDEEGMSRSLVPIESVIPIPIDVDRSIKEWQDYQRLCREILDDNDYATIKGTKARRRSGWAKLRRFYGITTRIIYEHRQPPWAEWEAGAPFMYQFLVEGRLGNRIEQADGTCEFIELEGGPIAPTEHNVRAKALTRAKNRVTSDLIGGGEVSAEELETSEAKKPQRPKKQRPKKQLPRVSQDALESIMIEASAQLEAMELEPHYKDKAHTLAAIKACGHSNTTFKYFTENHAQIVAELIDRVVAKTAAVDVASLEEEIPF